MLPKVRVDFICQSSTACTGKGPLSVTDNDIIGFWKDTYDVSFAIEEALSSFSIALADSPISVEIKEIAVKVTVVDEMPSINLQPALLQKIHTLKASLDIDIIQTVGK